MRNHKGIMLYVFVGIVLVIGVSVFGIASKKAKTRKTVELKDYVASTQSSWDANVDINNGNRDNHIETSKTTEDKQSGQNWIQSEDTIGANVETLPEKWQEGTIAFNGKFYRYNSSLKNYLFMGIDTDDPIYTMDVTDTGYQSDAMFVLVADSKNRSIYVIGINRNTMAEIVMYTSGGVKIATDVAQICLQHAYGDGKKISCERTVTAVAKLLDNVPIAGYLSLNVGGVPALNDAVGGVGLTIQQDITDESLGVTLRAGEQKNLNGQEAYCYLRKRDVDEFDSASLRLERQQQYLNAFLSKLQTSENQESMVQDLVVGTQDYTVTNLDLPAVLGEMMEYEYIDDNFYLLPGETVMGDDGFEQYIIDDEALQDMLIQIFYKEVDRN